MTLVRRTLHLITVLGLVCLLGACQSLSYYSQSVVGHSKLMLARTPVDKALASAKPKIASKLRLSKELKAFASSQLGLPDNNSYTTYVALQRDYPVWVVVAAPEFSLEAKQWCYLVVGCAAYRGYFSQSAAQRHAKKLRSQGWETYVSGASAYSTLGWFSDPLLPSMMHGSDASFAEVLFHELAHQRLYVNDRSGFNEAFATVVGEQGAQLWLEQNRASALPLYRANLQARRDFTELVQQFKRQLEGLYSSAIPEDAKRQAKQALFDQFKVDYRVLKTERWENRAYYDHWLLTPLNNARLASFSTYHELQPKLETLFKECGADFSRFYRHLETDPNIAKLDECIH